MKKINWPRIRYKIKCFFDIPYWCRWVFKPCNRPLIRNVPRSWWDRDNVLLHANFSILCDFVEGEMDGLEKLKEDIAWRRKEAEKIRIENLNPEDPNFIHWESSNMTGWADAFQVFADIYTWYTNVNWDDPVPLTPEYSEILNKDMKEFFETEPDENGLIEMKFSGDASHSLDQQKRENEFEDKCTEYLKKLIENRGFMWT